MKDGLLRQKWWKILTLLLLLYTFSVGLLIPLRPGIISIQHGECNLGDQLDIKIYAYNAHFSEEQLPRVFLKLDSIYVLEGQVSGLIDHSSLKARFELPSAIPVDEASVYPTLILHDVQNGFMVLPSALAIGATVKGGGEYWQAQIPDYDNNWRFSFPFRSILYETIRNTFYHVAIWMAMFILLIVALIYSIKYLRSPSMYYDAVSQSFTLVAVLFGGIGMVTGMVWAKNTWGAYWTDDPKLNLSAVSMIIFAGYLILRSSITDEEQRAKIAAAYNVFAFIAMIPLIFIIPRLTSSLHPGNGGNPALGGEDLDDTLRIVFYPTILGYTLLGIWMASLFYRLRRIDINVVHSILNSK